MENEIQYTQEQEKKVQQVEFEPLYTGLREVQDVLGLQQKLYINQGDVNFQIPLLKSLYFYYWEDYKDPLYKTANPMRLKLDFDRLFPNIAANSTWEPDYKDYDHNSLKWKLFTICKCFESEDWYLFYTDWWCIYSVHKQDFQTNGYMAESLHLLHMQWDKKSSIDVCNIDGRVGYFLDWALQWSLIWSCYTYVSDEDKIHSIYVWTQSSVYKSALKKEQDPITKKSTICHYDDEAIDLGLWKINRIALDPKKNLLFVISTDEEWNSNLHVLEHKKLFNPWEHIKSEIKTIESVSDINILPNWDIILTKWDWTLDFLNTNLNLLDTSDWSSFEMKTMKVNKAVDETRKSVLDSLWSMSVVVDSSSVSNEQSEEDRKIILGIREIPITIDWESHTFQEWFDNADTEEKILKVEKIFSQIKNNDQFVSIADLLKVIERKIIQKKNTILRDAIYSELDDICVSLDRNWEDLSTLLSIRSRLQSMYRKRQNIAFVEKNEKDILIKDMLRDVDEQIKKYQDFHKEEIKEELDSMIKTIDMALAGIEYAIDINSIRKTEAYKNVKELIKSLDVSEQEVYDKKLEELINKRLKEITENLNKERSNQKLKIQKNIESVEKKINQLKSLLENIDDISSVESLKDNDELVLEINSQLSELPSKEAQQLQLKLDKIFSERIFSLRLQDAESVWVIQNLDSYGIDTLLYYEEDGTEKVERKIEWKESKNPDKISLVVKVMNGETHEYDKSVYMKDLEKYGTILPVISKKAKEKVEGKIKFEMNDDEFLEYSQELSEWKNWWKEKFESLMREFKQLGTQKWMSERQRAIRDQLEDLMYKKFSNAIYTEKLMSNLIKAQKLNPRSKVPEFDTSYIVLDEEKDVLTKLSARLVDQKQNGGIDILEWWPWLWKTVMCEFLASVTNREIVRVQCSKMDPSDMFFSPTLKKWETSREPADWIKLMQKPWTIILFDEIDKLNAQCFERLHSLFDRSKSVYDPQLGKIKANPDCLFLWTRNSYDSLSNPIISRWRIMQISYPWKENESFKISKYTDNPILKKLSYDEFKQLRAKYIDRKEPAPNTKKDQELYKLIYGIEILLNIFTALREHYEDERETYRYELSYRDARQIFVDYSKGGNLKASIEWILIPKSRAAVLDKDEKNEQEQLVRRVIEAQSFID